MRKLAQICKVDTVLCADNQYVEGGGKVCYKKPLKYLFTIFKRSTFVGGFGKSLKGSIKRTFKQTF